MEKHLPVGFLEMFRIKQKLKKVFLYYGKNIRKHKHLKVTVLLDLIYESEIWHRASESTPLRRKYSYWEIFWSVFNSNAGQCRPEKLGI